MYKPNIVLACGKRTPFVKYFDRFANISSVGLGVPIVREICKTIHCRELDGVVWGNVLQDVKYPNLARTIALKSGLGKQIMAYTVNMNCASGLLAITTAAEQILLGRSKIWVAGGSESMSSAPVCFPGSFVQKNMWLSRQKNLLSKVSTLMKFRWKDITPQKPSFRDPNCGLTMSETVEILVKEYNISRRQQDHFSLQSHQRTIRAINNRRAAREIVPVEAEGEIMEMDVGPRSDTSMDKLARLNPLHNYNGKPGTITAGNSSLISDGGAGILVLEYRRAVEMGFKDLVRIRDHQYLGLEPEKMGLGPAYVIGKLLQRQKLGIKDIDYFEINEAFAGQVLACVKALQQERFCQKKLGWKRKVGKIPFDKLNVNGGALALGHPLGATGARLVVSAARELVEKKKKRALVALCVSGGLGAGMMLERC